MGDPIELRIHGVGGSTPEGLLGERHPENVRLMSGDERCGIWARRQDETVQGFVWGPLTSGSKLQPLWIILLPFTLVNAAGWMHPPNNDRATKWIRILVTWLGLTLTATWVLWLCIILGDLIAYQAGRHVIGLDHRPAAGVALAGIVVSGIGLAFRVSWPHVAVGGVACLGAAVGVTVEGRLGRTVSGLLGAGFVMLGLFVLAGRSRRAFEKSEESKSAWTGQRRRADDDEGLSSRSFFAHPVDSKWLLWWHGVATTVVLMGCLAWAWKQDRNGAEALDLGRFFVVVGAVQLALLGFLVVVSLGEFDRLERRWRVAGPAVTVTIALMLSNGVWAGVALWVRDRLKVQTGSELALLDVFVGCSLVALAALLLLWVPTFTVSRPAVDVAKPWRKKVGQRRQLARAFRHIDAPLSFWALLLLGAGGTIAAFRVDLGGWSSWPRLKDEPLKLTALAEIGAWVLPLAAVGTSGLIRLGLRSIGARRNIGNLWDVLTFWPRRFHPLGVRPYSEQAVPRLQRHIMRSGPMIIFAHSQGSILAFAALRGLNDESLLKRVALITCGSPLSRLHARFFPAYFGGSEFEALREQMADWRNFYRETDHIGQTVFDDAPGIANGDAVLADPATDQPMADQRDTDLEQDLEPGRLIAGHNSYRRERQIKACIGELTRRLAFVPEDLRGVDMNPPPPFPEEPAQAEDTAPFISVAATRGRWRPHRDGPQKRPADVKKLPFKWQGPVKWFSPNVLGRAALQVGVALAVGGYLDKRELQGGTPTRRLVEPMADDGIWIDFLADTGDGFPATYTMAWLLAQPDLKVPQLPEAEKLPRGHILVLGGDEVYPAASVEAYENRFVGPFDAAFPNTGPDGPSLYALPGNHDWYDGLTSFMRFFCQKKKIGSWRTRQERSYFAVMLGERLDKAESEAADTKGDTSSADSRWWLWGVDFQLDSYIDEPQLEYFEAQDVRPGDRIILCTGTPAWVDAKWDENAFRNLAYVERMIKKAEAELVLTLTGDKHHYARYEDGEGHHKITAGGGGAFLHPTHDLPEDVTLKITPSDTPDDQADQQTFTLAASRFPTEKDSCKLARWAPIKLLWKNPTFAIVPAVVHLLLLLSSAPVARELHGRAGDASQGPTANETLARALSKFDLWELAGGLFASPTALTLMLVFLAALIGFAKAPPRWQSHRFLKLASEGVMGSSHAALQLVAVVGAQWAAIHLAHRLVQGWWFTVLLFLLVSALGGIAGGVVMGLYLSIASRRFKAHGNECFSAMRLEQDKNFLRLHIDTAGVLTIYPIGVKSVSRSKRDWRVPNNATSGPWLVPRSSEPKPFLIEQPIEIVPVDIDLTEHQKASAEAAATS